MEADRRVTRRGEHEFAVRVPWRLDGPEGDPEAPLLLCLHGMGMDEDGFALLLQGLLELPVRLLVPRGPYPVEVRREGRIGASWYAYDGDQERFRGELARAEAIVLGLLSSAESAAGLRPRARWLLGFSQGGYLGAYVALRHPELFSGMIISGARVKTEFLEAEMPQAAAAGFAALLLHGQRDASVSPEAALRGRDALHAAGVDVELATVDAGHSLGRVQVARIREWLAGRT
jgi:predicted esterase